MNYDFLSKLYYSDQQKYDSVYQSRFNSDSTLKFDFTINGYQAFLVINQDILFSIDNIRKFDKKLDMAARKLPSNAIKQYAMRCIVEEVQLSNDIEGVRSTRKEIQSVLKKIDSKDESKNRRFHGIIQSYYMLLENKEISLKTCQDIRKLYDALVLKEIVSDDPKDMPDGTIFRKEQVEITTSTGKVIHHGLLPESRIIEAMTNALTMLNNDTLNIFIRICIFHYLFGYIHPFYDGNGRTSRFISSYLLSKEIHQLAGLGLSTIIKKHQKEYYNIFETTNDKKNKGDLTPFVLTFLTMIVENLIEQYEITQKTAVKFSYYEKAIDKIEATPKIKKVYTVLLQNTLFAVEKFGISELAHHASVTYPTAKSAIEKAEKQNLLRVSKTGTKAAYDFHLDELAKLLK